MILLLATGLLLAPAPSSFVFQRTYKAGDQLKFSFSMGPEGQPPMMTCEYLEAIKSVDGTVANATFTFDHMTGFLADSPAIPALTSKVGPNNLPGAASIKNGSEFALFGSIAGATPGSTVKVGDTVNLDWQDDGKDASFKGSGKVLGSDEIQKTLAVEWTIDMTPSYTTGGRYKLVSTYSISDFSLVKSVGTFTIGSSVLNIKVLRL